MGTLTNADGQVEYTFAPKTISQMTLTVTTVSGQAVNVGLGEIEVYGSPN